MDITNILEAVITLAVALITSILIPWLVKKYGAAKIDEVKKWVSTAVIAAEQLYSTIEKSGCLKNNHVKEFLKKKLGLTYDEETINELIEAEVGKLNEKEN